MFMLIFWILFVPILESFLWIFKCENGNHVIDEGMKCYEGLHILFVILSIIYIILLLALISLSAIFYKKIQKSLEDDTSKSIDNIEILLVLYRLVIAIFCIFATSVINFIM